MKFPKKSVAVVASVACSAVLALSLAGCSSGDSQNQGNGEGAGIEQQAELEKVENVDKVEITSAQIGHSDASPHTFIPVIEWTNSGNEDATFSSKYAVVVTVDGQVTERVESSDPEYMTDSEPVKAGKKQEVHIPFVYDMQEQVKVVVTTADGTGEVTSVDFSVDASGHDHEGK